jgi:hypothetical protein
VPPPAGTKPYDARPHAVHGGTDLPDSALQDTYTLTKRISTRVIEEDRAPTREDLDAALSGDSTAHWGGAVF